MRTCLVVLAALSVMAMAAAAYGEDTARYVLKQVDDGFLKLDSKSGSVSHCSRTGDAWSCRALDSPSDSARQISELETENAALRQRISELERRVADNDRQLKLPDDRELDRVMSMFERMIRRFLEFARSLDRPNGEKI